MYFLVGHETDVLKVFSLHEDEVYTLGVLLRVWEQSVGELCCCVITWDLAADSHFRVNLTQVVWSIVDLPGGPNMTWIYTCS